MSLDTRDARAADAIGLSRSRTFIPELESLRGIAVLLVFTFHVNGFVLYPFPSASDTVSLPMAFVRAGHTGVDLFFLLSAFLLSRPFLDDGLGGKPVRLRDYFARRALRILPLYWTAVLVGTLLSASHPADALRAVPHLLFISGIPALSAPLAPYGAVWWSLETEVQFYLLLSLLAVFLRTPARRWAGLALLGLYTGAYVIAIRGAVTHWSLQAQLALWNSVFGRGPLFLCGIAAAAVYRRFGSAWRTALASVAAVRSGGADGMLVATLLSLGLLLQWTVAIGSGRFAGVNQWWHVAAGAAWAVVLLLLLVAPLRLAPILCNPLLSRLGVVSYSVYILHAPFMLFPIQAFVGRRAWTPWAWTLVSMLTVALLVTCSATYRFIERPFLVRKARFDT
jgi:peptidoglycan/LPS O-acetylase OafA/YrhL